MNDLPGLTAQLARSRGMGLRCEMYAPGGYTLRKHSSDRQLVLKLAGKWDVAVLQEQSQLPAYPWAETEVLPYARRLAEAARAANPGVKLLFYMTMARKYGDRQAAARFPEIATYEGMQKELDETYEKMAAAVGRGYRSAAAAGGRRGGRAPLNRPPKDKGRFRGLFPRLFGTAPYKNWLPGMDLNHV